MPRIPHPTTALCLTLTLLLLPTTPTAATEPSPAELQEADPLPGVDVAQTVATATGIAITPLLGVSAVGAWQFYRAEEQARPALPWYASPWFWGPGLLVALLLVFKDPVLGLFPGAKKPLDAVDVVENKVSALLASPAVLSMLVGAFAMARPAGEAAGGAGVVSQAGLPGWVGQLPGAMGWGIAGVIFLAAFFCIWLAFHAINVLILLSPFGPLDMFLRSIKLGVLTVLVGGTLVHPYLGLLISIVILLIAMLVAGWSFRLMVFGGVLALDLISMRHRREQPDPGRLRAFTCERLGSARARTFGVFSVEGARVVFTYRPWLVFPRRTCELPAGTYTLGRGVLCPMLRLEDSDGARLDVLRLAPRYRGHEEQIVSVLALSGVEDLPLVRGIKAAVAWLREMAGRSSRHAARLASEVRERVAQEG